jgi:hypothetical protein
MMYVGMHRLYPILSPPCGVVRDVRVLVLTALLTLAAAAPAAADPVLVAPLKPCYASDGAAPTQRETIHLEATGFTPAGHVVLKLDGQILTDGAGQPLVGQADVAGTVVADVAAPFQGIGERLFTIQLLEIENTKNVLTATAMVTNLSVTLRPKRARPSRKVRFSGRGFTKDAPIWGHYVFGGKVRKTIRLAPRPESPCGVFHAKRRQIPVRKPAVGDWTLQVDQQRRYSPHPASNAQRVFIRVRESPRTP